MRGLPKPAKRGEAGSVWLQLSCGARSGHRAAMHRDRVTPTRNGQREGTLPGAAVSGGASTTHSP
ncbi:hypothetical protein GGR71_000351 [Xanthomonas sp. F1]